MLLLTSVGVGNTVSRIAAAPIIFTQLLREVLSPRVGAVADGIVNDFVKTCGGGAGT